MYIISITFAKIIYWFIKLFNIGAGFTWPGHFVLKMNPRILKEISKRLPDKVVLISGTNGKTTTAKLATHILRRSGYKVLHNDTGANLLNGIVSTALLNSDYRGELNFDYTVFELDEFTLPRIMQEVRPRGFASYRGHLHGCSGH